MLTEDGILSQSPYKGFNRKKLKYLTSFGDWVSIPL